jgi:hypothetical protein
MSVNDIKIPSGTLAELRGALVRCLSRENLSLSDKIAIRKSQSSSSLKIHYTWNSNIGGKRTFHSVSIQILLRAVKKKVLEEKLQSRFFVSSLKLFLLISSMCAL